MMLNGYILLHRKLMQWGWYRNDVIKSVFIHLLLSANFQDAQWEGITIKRGQLVTSYKNLALDIGHTVQEVRTAINKLKSTREITCTSTNKFTLITIVNWEDYQIPLEFVTSKSTSTLTNEQQTTNKQLTFKQQTTNNNVIRKNKDNKKEEGREDYAHARETSPRSAVSPADEDIPKAWGGKDGKGYLILSESQFSELLDMMPLEVFDSYSDKITKWIAENKPIKNHYELIKKWYNEDYGGASEGEQ